MRLPIELTELHIGDNHDESQTIKSLDGIQHLPKANVYINMADLDPTMATSQWTNYDDIDA